MATLICILSGELSDDGIIIKKWKREQVVRLEGRIQGGDSWRAPPQQHQIHSFLHTFLPKSTHV